MEQVNQEIKIEKFEAFYEWLKADGLAPRKSERLHKKRIFQNLLNNQEMTIENFQDFLKELEKEEEEKLLLKSYQGKTIKTIQGVFTIDFVIKEENNIKVNYTNGEFTTLPNIQALSEIIK